MNTIDDLVNQARALGEAIATHPEIKAYLDARTALDQDAGARQLLEDYTGVAQRIQQLEAQQQPIEVADKQKLTECQQQMASNETLKNIMRTQADYITIMNRVNQAMEAPLAPKAQQ